MIKIKYRYGVVYIILIMLNITTLHSQYKLWPFFISSNSRFINSICFTKGGTLLAYSDGSDIQIRNLKDNSLYALLQGGHKDRVLTLDYSPDSTMIVSGGRDSLILLWDVNNKRIITRLDYHDGKVTAVKFDPDGNFIYSGSTDKRLICFSIKDKKIIFDKKVHSSDILSIDISSNGRMLASGGADHSVYILDTKTGDVINNLEKCKNWVRCVKFNPNSATLATCCDNGSIYFWKINDPFDIEFLYRQKLSSGWITSMDFFPNNVSFAYALENGKVGVSVYGSYYTFNTRRPVQMIKVQPCQNSKISLGGATWGKGVFLMGPR